jgi:hypothetical protein
MLLFIMLTPQLFVFSYYCGHLIKGANKPDMAKSLFVFALTVAWVSAPLLLALGFAFKTMLARRARWHTILPLGAAAGFVWLALWNLTVHNSFSYARSVTPLLICVATTVGLALARHARAVTAAEKEHRENTVPGLPG